MKPVILSILLFVSFVHGQSNEPYKRALKAYNQKDFSGAYTLFNRLLGDSSVPHKRINFYIGRCASELKLYDKALMAYERVLMSDPNNSRTKLEIAQTYFLMKHYKQAKNYFSMLLKEPLPLDIKTKVDQKLRLIKTKRQKHFFNAQTIFSLGYDNNVNSASDADEYSVYIPTLNSNIIVPTSDVNEAFFTEAGVVGQYIYKMSDKWFLKNNLTVFALNYHHHSENNLLLSSLNIAPTTTYLNKRFTFNFYYDVIAYGGDVYLEDFSFAPKMSLKINPYSDYQLYLKYGYKRYKDVETQNKNAYVYEIYNGFSIKNGEKISNQFSLLVGKVERVSGSTRLDNNRKYYKLQWRNRYKLTSKYSLNNRLYFKEHEYSDYDINFLNHREDNTMSYHLSLQLMQSLSLKFDFSYQYIKNNSNQTPYDYDKHISKCSLYYTF
jgi:tetratricopeptide (TPR) repeat protein